MSDASEPVASNSVWLPDGFEHPARVEIDQSHHLRPIEPDDAVIDYRAVMGSRERLWARYGERFGWPRATMTLESDRADLERHAREMIAHVSFNYALFDENETRVLGCVYIDPPTSPEHDAEVSWWLVDEEATGSLRDTVNRFVPSWLRTRWRFSSPRLDPADGMDP